MSAGIIGLGLDDPSITWRARKTIAPASTIVGVDFGAAVTGRNQKWGLLCLTYYNDATISITGVTFGGVAASVVYQATVTSTYSQPITSIVLAAQIDSLTSGDVAYSDDTAAVGYADVLTVINLDASTVIDSAIAAGATTATLSIDCPAGGGIIGQGVYGAASGSATSAAFANLTGLNFYDNPSDTTGHSVSGSVFASAQTGLDVSYTPSPASRRPTAFALSFAGV